MKYYTYQMLEANGRLGNQLWQIASTVGLAHKAGMPPRFKSDWEYRNFFSVPDEFFEPLEDGAELKDGGTEYLQEIQYLEGVESLVKQMFYPSRRSQDYMNAYYGDILNLSNTCSIHVRRGDYLKYPKHFSRMTPKYYESAMELLGDVNFVVFSDDIRWCKQNFSSECHFIDGIARPVEVADRLGEPEDQYDLFLMTACKHHIISNSTFSWWGAWLSEDKSPIYPNKWYERELSYIPWEKMIPENWRKVQC